MGGRGEKSRPISPDRWAGREERVVWEVELERWERARAITFVLP